MEIYQIFMLVKNNNKLNNNKMSLEPIFANETFVFLLRNYGKKKEEEKCRR